MTPKENTVRRGALVEWGTSLTRNYSVRGSIPPPRTKHTVFKTYCRSSLVTVLLYNSNMSVHNVWYLGGMYMQVEGRVLMLH